MTDQIYDPSADVVNMNDMAPAELPPFSKARFGEYLILNVRGKFEAGVERTISGLTYMEGGVQKQFTLKGFNPNPKSDQVNVLIFQRVTRTQGDRTGDQFIISSITPTSSKAYHEVVSPGLIAVFGDLKSVPLFQWFFAHADEIPHGKPSKGRDKPNSYYKFVELFKTEDAMRAAEKKFFDDLGVSAGGEAGDFNPYAAAGMAVPAAWTDAPNEFWSEMPKIRAALELISATPTPMPKFLADPGVKVLLNELAYERDEAVALYNIRDAVLAVSA